jgi:hypothetical protein
MTDRAVRAAAHRGARCLLPEEGGCGGPGPPVYAEPPAAPEAGWTALEISQYAMTGLCRECQPRYDFSRTGPVSPDDYPRLREDPDATAQPAGL